MGIIIYDMNKLIKRVFLLLIIIGLLGATFIIYANWKIESETENYITSDPNKLPIEHVGLVLGTSKLLANGSMNPYFKYRIDAAEELYKAGKIKNIIVSGDNSRKTYNEPEDMKNELLKRGVPEIDIYMDFAGLRTLDSVIRAREIFGQHEYIIISQEFHNERAVFIARENGINAFGFNAQDVNKAIGIKTMIREKFARAKVFWDFLFSVQPKYGGEKIFVE
ncbi:SanA protein [Elizabethkingia anophelis]|nr:SanA protein [Elizabethkingia anophelis]MCW2469206.1 SanA protein [Elizabethkingia anophelis]